MVTPNQTQMNEFLEGDIDSPISMVNLLKFKEIKSLIYKDLQKLLCINSEPIFTHETVWKKSIPQYMLRLKMKAGLTGWAQINGWRGNTSLEKRIEYDLYYIKNWSLWFDLKIMFMTLWKGVVNRHAF